MTRMRSILLHAALTGLLTGACATGAERIQMRTLAKGNFSRIDTKQEKVIRTAEDWNELWKKHSATRKQATNVPPVDFSKEMVVAVDLGKQRTDGYKVEITGVRESGSKLEVLVNRTAPPPDSPVIQVITSPFHYVAVPRSARKVDFVAVDPEK